MPQSLVKKVADKCNMDTGEVEDIGEKAKEKAAEQGHEEDGGYITSIFKSMVPGNCKDKMNGNKNEEGGHKMSIEEKIEKYLNEGSSGSLQKGDIVKVVKKGGNRLLQVKGTSWPLGPEDIVTFKNTSNVKKKGLSPGDRGQIIEINKDDTVKIATNTGKKENAVVTLPITDIYWD